MNSLKIPVEPHYCESFEPLVNRRSRVLILGSMPGPEALRKQQYYGFSGNHFWKIIPALVGTPVSERYEDRKRLILTHHLALWDVLRSCVRPGALDSAIRNPVPNDIPGLLKRYPNIVAIFINGQFAYKMFMKNYGDTVDLPVEVLPSTSPAHASITLAEKAKRWSSILKFAANSLKASS